ncbi:MAG: PP2C family protein-serine/threonine phosphatase [Candidatus Acidiferrales bacterium]
MLPEGIETKPVTAKGSPNLGSVSIVVRDGDLPEATSEEAAKVLVEHLFAPGNIAIPGASYAVGYKLSEGPTGGDIVDIYQYDNNSIAFSIADISGKGPRAAINAALIKFGLRAYSSAGMTPERVTRALDRLYLENNAFEKTESFASVFFGIVDPTRRLMNYKNAGHEPVLLIATDGIMRVLPPTAPLVGVFDDQHHLFQQAFVEIDAGMLFVGATDGATEARNENGDLFGMDRLIETAVTNRKLPESEIVQVIVDKVLDFSAGRRRDDIAVVAVRFL